MTVSFSCRRCGGLSHGETESLYPKKRERTNKRLCVTCFAKEPNYTEGMVQTSLCENETKKE